MGSKFSDIQITSWAYKYEKELCAKHDLIADRISLQIIPGVNEYELPNYITNIRSVLYMGKELHPKGGEASMLTGDVPFQTGTATPYEYVYSNKGLRVIKLYPTPGDTIAEYVGDLWTADADRLSCIIEFYRVASPSDPNLQLPDWCRRYLLKDYICFKAFSSEGSGQHLVAAAYYKGRMQQQEEYIMKIKTNMNMGKMNILYDTKMRGRRKPGHPVLPPNFGYPIYG